MPIKPEQASVQPTRVPAHAGREQITGYAGVTLERGAVQKTDQLRCRPIPGVPHDGGERLLQSYVLEKRVESLSG
jgi:hypothetical protein